MSIFYIINYTFSAATKITFNPQFFLRAKQKLPDINLCKKKNIYINLHVIKASYNYKVKMEIMSLFALQKIT
jgi:hypothetical protein